MSLFQKSVLKKYTNDLNKENLEKKWELFKAHFHNPEVQENIRNAKEEEYQAGFVDDLFVKILGYTVYPNLNFSFRLEKKTDADTTKSDGAILVEGKVVGVLELKDTNTTDLGKVEKQAFGYKHKHPECIYIITSNFQKLRFYINDSIEFIEFDLFKITKEEFVTLVICLEQQHIFKNIPYLIKRNSLDEEKEITNKLYADYSQFKRVLFNNIVALNPQYNKLELFKKTQKLLDRFLFLLFAEDRLLVPANSVRGILSAWEKLKELDNYVPLFERFKKFFVYLNIGHEDKHHEIFAYNGGLFAADEVLDNINIDDDILYKGTTTLSGYDFESDVDVNILGHIFEHSLTEIEEVQAELEGSAIDKIKTKRKKDGVFYTPRFITKYIVENTVGELCRQKKEELKIIDEEFAYRKRKDARGTLLKRLEDYRNWLFQLTICDPACGSGAFLNQALEFLIGEHNYVDELKATLFGDAMVLTEVENTILENNLFGVDINEEAVEIARLSLWLRTARKGRKLNDLSNNIKCGNSLINATEIITTKAFNWELEFSGVFENGGFDIVIGNPPYGAKFSKIEKSYLKKRYALSTSGKIDSYRIFFQKSFEILKEGALISFITPNTFLYNVQSKLLRKEILANLSILDAVELRKNIFEDAPDVVTVILTLKKEIQAQYNFRGRVAYSDKKYKDLKNDEWEIDQLVNVQSLKKDPEQKINLRAENNFKALKDKLNKLPNLEKYLYLKQGTKPYGDKESKEEGLLSKVKFDQSWEKAINGRNITRYYIDFEDEYVQRSEKLHTVLSPEIINNEKIYFQRMRKISLFPRLVSCYDNDSIHGLYTCSVIYKKDTEVNLKYALCILNSLLINIWYKNFDTDIEIKLETVKKIPFIKLKAEEQKPFIDKADSMLVRSKEFMQVKQQLHKLLLSKYKSLKLTKKLEDWHSLDFKDFLKELTKQKIKLSLSEEADWMKYFEEQKIIANGIQKEIKDTDKEINNMVYELYELTPEEIKMVDGMAN